VKGKAIILIGVVMGLMAGALVLLMVSRQPAASASAPTPVPVPVVRAAQNIPKGHEITLEVVQLVPVAAGEPVPAEAVRDPMAAVGMTAAMDIPQGTVLQAEMYYDREAASALGQQRPAELFQPGRVAVSMPVGDLARVAGGIRDGDHVNVIASFEMIDVDRETQIRKPAEGEGVQIPRLTTQTILQDVEVLRVGPWIAGATATGGAEAGTAPVDLSGVVTVLVTPQDSVVLKWLIDLASEGEASVTLALRADGDSEASDTDAATLEYLIRRFRVPNPPKLDVTTDTIVVRGAVEPR